MDNAVTGNEQYALAFDFAPVQLVRAVSRRTHGAAADVHDIELPLTGQPLGVESRSGAHQVVFSFAGPVTFNTAVYFWTDETGSHRYCTAPTGGPINSVVRTPTSLARILLR